MSVVVGYAPGRLGGLALAAAMHEARRIDTQLIVVHVERPQQIADATMTFIAELPAIRGLLEQSGLVFDLRHLITDRTPAAALVDVLEETGAVLAVIGVRSRSAVGKFLLGSTAQSILLHAPCPVLAVKTEPAAST